MISTRTPLRVTLGGGGTDLQSYYRHRGGFIFAMALDKHIHITAHRPAFDSRVVLYGPQPEASERAMDVRHELVRAALIAHGLDDRMEASSLADIAGGTGLGSSSSFLVGFLNALHALKGHTPDPHDLAEEACRLEIDTLQKGIGKQDQYMAAFGGLTTLDIAPDGEVVVGRVDIPAETKAAFIRHTHIYYTGLRRDAAVILSDQNGAMQTGAASSDRDRVRESLDYIRDLGFRIRDAWIAGDLDGWGRMLDEHWQHKKQLSSKISLPHIDQLYDHVRSNYGVTGGKVIGAGGGGFLMLFCPTDGKALEAYMAGQNMPRLNYGIDPQGSRVLGGLN
jgi:D-glycero-alpha-D-manno-heptose-7-phosphate kinase